MKSHSSSPHSYPLRFESRPHSTIFAWPGKNRRVGIGGGVDLYVSITRTAVPYKPDGFPFSTRFCAPPAPGARRLVRADARFPSSAYPKRYPFWEKAASRALRAKRANSESMLPIPARLHFFGLWHRGAPGGCGTKERIPPFFLPKREPPLSLICTIYFLFPGTLHLPAAGIRAGKPDGFPGHPGNLVLERDRRSKKNIVLVHTSYMFLFLLNGGSAE